MLQFLKTRGRIQLYVGKLTERFLLDENGTVKSIELEELKPKSWGGSDLEQQFIGNQSYVWDIKVGRCNC